jgi:Calcineurin-like phosphoesterase
MKKMAFAFLPLLLVGFILPDTSFYSASTIKMASDNLYDGPYVLYKNDQVFIKTIFDDGGLKSIVVDSVNISQKGSLSLIVATDEPGKTFLVKLKNNLQVEKSEYKKISKQVVISDIEGNFMAFRKLLQNSGVIDNNYNWIFGDGHLVLTGDFFDRGDRVTEVLWLIYSLEDKAKAAGGYVHFVLGNHEIMNLSGDLRYLHPKYVQDTALLKENYVGSLYGENSELGRWLRTKNIVEKVGNILFMHGGMSAEMNSIDIPLNKINELARPYYSDTTYQYTDPQTEIIYSDWGPFWYRGYYQGKIIAPVSQIDSTLERFNVKHIVTGHTMIADTISVLHNGKLINIDVHHAKGHSEALLIDGGKYYRITIAGEKLLMME